MPAISASLRASARNLIFLSALALCAQSPSAYTLGPNDKIAIRVLNAEEIGKGDPLVIDARGNITLPMLGRIRAAGLTPEQLELDLETRAKPFIHEPDVTVQLLEMRSQPISVLGSVEKPGVHQVEGEKTLFEALSMAGGLRPDAGNSIRITRRLEWGRIPLPTAKDDPTGTYSTASVSVKDIMSAARPEENVPIRPHDVISVPRADLIYVIGAVRKPGGFVMNENESLSALQVLSLSEGLERGASPKGARIMRPIPGSTDRQEIPINLSALLQGKGEDVRLKADDILFVPTSVPKNAAIRGMEAALQIGTGLAIYRR